MEALNLNTKKYTYIDMTDFLQLFFSGLATGSIYALAALGFTLLWQASATINFAQGEFVMLPVARPLKKSWRKSVMLM